MPIDEVFPNPTVKQVIFQMRFPNLFYLESKIGEYQVEIIEEFPESKLGVSRNIVIANLMPGATIEGPPDSPGTIPVEKIWNFTSRSGVELNVHSNSLDIVSGVHKTYSNPEVEHRFRDVIELAVGKFLEVTSISMLKRVGLRYMDDCHVPACDNAAYKEWYKTTFPLARFPLKHAIEMSFQTRTRRRNQHLIFKEILKVADRQPSLTLDFDGYAENVDADAYLSVTDDLHALILSEWRESLKEPAYEYMRRPRE